MSRKVQPAPQESTIRIGRAAEILGVSVDTVRRWVDAGRLASARSEHGQRVVALGDVTSLARQRRESGEGTGATGDSRSLATSARNRFPGVVTRVEVDRVAAIVEIQAGPHRLVSLMTAEAAIELGLRVGDPATAVVKATNVVIDVP